MTISIPASRAPAVCFTQASATVELSCNLPAALHAAAATLHAYERSERTPDWRVHIQAVARLPKASEHHGFASASAQEIGRGDNVRAIDVADERLFLIEPHHTLVVLAPTRRQITAYCTNEQHALALAIRLVRQAMTAELLLAGAVYAHAAAARIRGRGVMICAHKNHGKTTTLIALLRHLPGSDFVSNDRLLLHESNFGVIGHTWPSHIRAGIGTLLAYPDLTDLVPTCARALAPEQRWRAGKVSIEPDQFPRFISSGEITSSCEISALIWPTLSPEQHGTHIKPVPAAEVERELVATRLFMLDPNSGISCHVNHWLIPAPPTAEQTDRIRHVGRALAASVPCFRVRAGLDPAALAAAIGEVVQ